MATIKMCTDIPQSKVLAKILPYESADMYYREWKRDTKDIRIAHVGTAGKEDLPCWSLATLLSVLPEGIKYYAPNLQKEDGKYSIAYGDDELLCIADNPVDACYKFILTLHEEKVL